MKISVSTLLGSVLVSSLMMGCGGSSSSSTKTENPGTGSTTRFKSVTMMNQIVMQDNSTQLEWVNGAGGCHPMGSGKTEAAAFTESFNHCDSLVFAGHSDWRVPSPTEIQEFTVEMNKVGKTPFYANPACPRVVGTSDRATNLSTVNTHNTPPLGTIAAWANTNAGVRCVRGI